MTHFKTRNQLLEFLEEHGPYRMIRRAVVEGEVELYGYFEDSVFMPEGWAVRVKSRFGKEWFVSVYLNSHTHEYRAMVMHTIVWDYWKGGNSELFQGDHPEEYERKKQEWDTTS